jgi:hypothetical protein
MLRGAVALKNADHLLDEVMKAVDTDGNGRISYNGKSYLHDSIPRVSHILACRIPNLCRRNRKGAASAVPGH